MLGDARVRASPPSILAARLFDTRKYRNEVPTPDVAATCELQAPIIAS